MEFLKYPKIHRLGATENSFILVGTCYIQEKLDGANASIWMEDGEIVCASRNQMVGRGGFNGFWDYAQEHQGIKQLLEDEKSSKYRLYGEWLVKHSIPYPQECYKKFYLYDIEVDGEYLLPDKVLDLCQTYDILTPKTFAVLENPTEEEVKAFVGQSSIAEKGEGIVIKNPDFVNKFGEKVYAKIVTPSFSEENSLLFGGNNKHADSYWELYVMNKYITIPRVQKVMNKIQPQVEKSLDMEHTSQIISTVYHDMLTEEIWNIQKKCEHIDFNTLRRVSTRKAAILFHGILNGESQS